MIWYGVYIRLNCRYMQIADQERQKMLVLNIKNYPR